MCAKAEHCTYEMEQKLRSWGIATDDAEVIIHSLTRRRFVDDVRYAHAFVRDRYRYGHYGRAKIRMLLQAKRIDAQVIAEALEDIEQTEYESILNRLLAAKAKAVGDLNVYENRNKLYRYGLSRGFESAMVAGVVKALAANFQ